MIVSLAEEFLCVVLPDRRASSGHGPLDHLGTEPLGDRQHLDLVRPRPLDSSDRASQRGQTLDEIGGGVLWPVRIAVHAAVHGAVVQATTAWRLSSLRARWENQRSSHAVHGPTMSSVMP